MAIAEPMAPIEPKIDNQKQMDADVMDVVKRKGKPKQPQQLQDAKEKIKQIIVQQKIDPQKLVRVGEMAEYALKNKELYPMVMQQMVKEGLATEEDANAAKDPKQLAGVISAGKIAKMLIDEGQIK